MVNKILKKQLFSKSFLLFITVFNLFIFFERKFLFFRDYSIIWDGAYRLSKGLLPYSDFGIPLGPVGFYLPALFFKLFGPSWLVLQLSQLIINLVLIYLAFGILKQLTSKKYEIYLGLIFFNFNYIILLTHPWYNTTAILFFLLSILLTLYKKSHLSFFAGLTCAAAIFTKQDYALMTIISIFFITILLEKDKNNNNSLFVPKSLSTIIGRFKSKYLLFLILGLALGLIFFLSIYDLSQMSYWFNYGQYPHTLRKPDLINSIFYPQIYLSIFCLWLAFKNKDFSLLIVFFFLLTSGLCSQTSGLKFTSGFFYFLIPLTTAKFIKYNNNLWKILSLLFLIFISMFNNIQRSISIFKAALKNKIETPTMHYSDLRAETIRLEKCAKEFRNIYGPESICKQVDLIRDEIENKKIIRDLTFLNMSELTPILSIFNFQSHKSLPLWFDEKVTLFEREKKIIREHIKNQKFDIIALQATHDPWNSFYNEILQIILNNPYYKELGESQLVSPKGSLVFNYISDNCKTSQYPNYSFSEKCEESLKPIRFFIKKKI